ncbi:MAG TPA: YqgE/AlgH family protein [Niabella sp.]|nr:YqgE/AlgH family protein [Niabella sp.]HOZ98049.1 YqgE/AlgH family protein [Niabella sp.]HQW14806.1 YqgE/AlgH family protein [Niabella sp.]HQX18569.1 YqgE/AlgH family protein [Niabella sp.]HQX40789.1 YqgE/AlgH family protein [Niabella sp.]
MKIKQGTILQCTSQWPEDYFFGSRILITARNEDGYIGFILNKKFPRVLNELVEFIDCPPFPLCEGGPVEHEKLFFIHSRPDLISGSLMLSDEWYYGGDFSQAVHYLNMGMLDERSLKIFIGYCGWDAGQLEAEMTSGEWLELSDFDICS